MKITYFIVTYFIFLSGDSKYEQVEKGVIPVIIEIPSIEKRSDDIGFELVNGVLMFEGSPYSGVLNDFYPDKKLKSTSEYFKGKRYGIYYGWYPNGNKWFERYYSNGVKTGSHIGWFRDSRKMFYFEFNSTGAYHGVVKEWHSNGSLAKHFNFEDGKEAGSQKMWGQDGRLGANFYTVNGERHGLIGLKNCAGVAANK